MKSLPPAWTAGIYVTLLAGVMLAVAFCDGERLFQYITYVPAFLGLAFVVATGLLLLGRTKPLPSRGATLVLAALSGAAFLAVCAAPVVPTSRCKGFYVAQRRLAVGMPVQSAYHLLEGFDAGKPYVPSPGWVSFRCQSDSSTVDYVIVRVADDGRSIAAIDYLLD